MPSNIILDYMKKSGVPMTVENYAAYNWGQTVERLEGENLGEVLDLVEDGILSVTTPSSKAIN